MKIKTGTAGLLFPIRAEISQTPGEKIGWVRVEVGPLRAVHLLWSRAPSESI